MRGLSADALTDAEAAALFGAHLPEVPAPVLLAVSGGPDSTALMGLYVAARQRAPLPEAIVVTVDHGLRPEAREEAARVAARAHQLGLKHRLLTWAGDKPATGIQDAARQARYGLIGACAAATGARAVMTAHTLDDQAETVLMRLTRGSGLHGLGGMEPLSQRPGYWLVRPLLTIAKTRLLATCAARGWEYERDPSNLNRDFARVRLRQLMPLLAAEGLDAARIAVFARRMRSAGEALEMAARKALTEAVCVRGARHGYDAARLAGEPDEVVVGIVRLLIEARRAESGGLAPLKLNRIEALAARLLAAQRAGVPFAATLGGVRFALRQNLLTCLGESPRRSGGG